MTRGSQVTRAKQDRHRIIVEIIAQGILNQGEIAQKLADEYGIVSPKTGKPLSRATISTDLKAVDELTMERMTQSRKLQKTRHQLKLEYLYREAIEAWHKSKEDKEVSIQESVDIEKPGDKTKKKERTRNKVQLRKEGSSGNSAHLTAAKAILEDIAQLWGLNDPALLDIKVEGGQPQLSSIDIHQAMRELEEWDNVIEGEVKQIEG